MSALEMARKTFKEPIHRWSNYLIRHTYNNVTFTSGSIRAWLECGYSWDDVIQAKSEQFPCANIKDWMQHKYQAVKFITNRSMSHELVRHRVCSFMQESQRYVRYDKPGGIEFIKPLWLKDADDYTIKHGMGWSWQLQCSSAESTYRSMINNGMSPQQARGVLPNDTKTELILYASLREWQHIFYQRTQGGADPAMKSLMLPVLEEFRSLYSGLFDELTPSIAGR
jgi:flavin-dependent thymidylate synthase